MQCPNCSGFLVVKRQGEVTVDHCDSCGGIWFDPDELSDYVRRNKSWLRAHVVTDDDFQSLTDVPGGNCPRCREDSLRIGFFNGLSFERCTKCSGFFLSPEHLRAITEWLESSEPPVQTRPVSAGEAVAEGAVGVVLEGALYFVVSLIIPS